jgi:hypothetical protein
MASVFQVSNFDHGKSSKSMCLLNLIMSVADKIDEVELNVKMIHMIVRMSLCRRIVMIDFVLYC